MGKRDKEEAVKEITKQIQQDTKLWNDFSNIQSDEQLKQKLDIYLDDKNINIPDDFYKAIVLLRDRYFESNKYIMYLMDEQNEIVIREIKNKIIHKIEELKKEKEDKYIRKSRIYAIDNKIQILNEVLGWFWFLIN